MIECPCGIAKVDCDYHKPVVSLPLQPSIPSTGRGSGRTTSQLLALPKGGWYFCKSVPHCHVIKVIANHHGRTDIVLKPIDDLRDYYQFHGCQIPGFDIDHYVQEQGLDQEIIDGASKLRSCVKP